MSDNPSSQLSILSSLSRTSSPTSSSGPPKPPSEFKYQGRKYIRIEHEENKRSGHKSSPIWDNGTEYIDLSNPDLPHRWRCDSCRNDVIYNVGKPKAYITSGAYRHFVKRHKFVANLSDATERSITAEAFEEEDHGISEVTSLTTTLKVDKFRRSLL